MKYIVVGTTIVNSIVYYDGTRIQNILGGGGIYSFSGVRMFDDKSMLITAVGEDFDDYFGEWYDKNNMVRDGLNVLYEHTVSSVLTYYDEYGNYKDVSIYTPDGTPSLHAPKAHLDTSYAKPFVDSDTKGLYLMSDGCQLYEDVSQSKKDYGFKIMWELPINIGDGRVKYDEFLDQVHQSDIYSLNKPESFRLFSVDNEQDAIKRILDIGLPCFYRVGKKGSYIIAGDKCYFFPVVNIVAPKDEKDATGCGNSSTAAVMWGFCEGYDPIMTAMIGNVMSGYNAMQYGPVPVMDDGIRKEALSKAKELYDHYLVDYSIDHKIIW